MPDWAVSINDVLFRFVTRGPAWGHVLVFAPLGLLAGIGLARWSGQLMARESSGARQLSRLPRLIVIGATIALYSALVLAVIQGNCQSLVEGGSIDWAHWRLVYHDALLGLLLVATVIDFDQYLIPDDITFIGALIGVVGATVFGNLQLMPIWVDWNNADPIMGAYIPEWIKFHPHWHGLAWSLAGLIAGAGITWLARFIAQSVLGVEALGFGDVTLMGMIGSFLGWQAVVFVFLLAPLCGIVIGLSARLLHGRRAMPYGPYLSAASVVVLFTWRWLWIPTRDVFGHGPTLAALGILMTVGLATLLGLLRLYRSIPVTRRAEGSAAKYDEDANAK